ncbi:hypothetical protein F7725_023477 [Dissostichus mawsoni]|uniref:Pyrin domain-containing protein n=1 Tax=Dissostichus mawsoni TaxID=36200 RepID=A0A7J5Z0T5_DISMA|nr:hypothetical protein F7725_023477 [Dissostichus mawsoni]
MATLKKILFRTLEHLGKEDFEEFKWHLQQKVLGFEGIPKSRLEDACRTQTVDHMFLNYCINTIKVTRNVLKEMNQNLLEEKLSKIPSEPTGWTMVESREGQLAASSGQLAELHPLSN